MRWFMTMLGQRYYVTMQPINSMLLSAGMRSFYKQERTLRNVQTRFAAQMDALDHEP